MDRKHRKGIRRLDYDQEYGDSSAHKSTGSSTARRGLRTKAAACFALLAIAFVGIVAVMHALHMGGHQASTAKLKDVSTRVRAKPVVVQPAADGEKQEPVDVGKQADVAQQGLAAQDSSGKVTHDVLGGAFKHDPATNVTPHVLDTAKAGNSLEAGLGQTDRFQSTSAAGRQDSGGPTDIVTAGGVAAGAAGQQGGGAGSGGGAGANAGLGDSGSGGGGDDDSDAANNDKLAEEAAVDTDGFFDDEDYGDPYNSTTDVDPDQDELGGGDEEEEEGDADGAAGIDPDADPDSADEEVAEEGAGSAGGETEAQRGGDADLGGDIGDDDEDEAPDHLESAGAVQGGAEGAAAATDAAANTSTSTEPRSEAGDRLAATQDTATSTSAATTSVTDGAATTTAATDGGDGGATAASGEAAAAEGEVLIPQPDKLEAKAELKAKAEAASDGTIPQPDKAADRQDQGAKPDEGAFTDSDEDGLNKVKPIDVEKDTADEAGKPIDVDKDSADQQAEGAVKPIDPDADPEGAAAEGGEGGEGQQERRGVQEGQGEEVVSAEVEAEIEKEITSQESCGPLSKELLDQYAVNNTVLVTFTNSIMWHNFGATWMHHIKNAGITYWVLAVADNHTAHLVHSQGAHQCFLVHENEIDNTNATFKWGSTSWRLTTWQKVLTVRHVHHLGFNVINSDMDVVWLRNPLDHFLVKYPHPDYWVSMDPITTRNPIGDDGPELGVTVHHYMNTGVYFLRQTPGGRALIDKWYDIRKHEQAQNAHDQDGLYHYLSKNNEEIDPKLRITRVVDGKTALAQLPASLFQNGYSHCINQMHKVHGTQPFEVHFVWVWGGNVGKMTRMREQQYFIDPPEYHAGPDFLSMDIVQIQDPVGYNDWNDTEAMVMQHLTAVEAQLVDMWYGLALAALLRRTIILPKMKCYCVQNWFENPLCRLPGEPFTRFPLSPACPADFVFNMDALAAFNVSGVHVPFREYSFLDNPRTPEHVKKAALLVTADPAATEASRKGDVLTIPARLKSDDLYMALMPYVVYPEGDAPKRVHFTNPREAFGGWSDPRVAEEYEAHVRGLAVRWCCRPDKVAQQHGKDLHHQLRVLPKEEPIKDEKQQQQQAQARRALMGGRRELPGAFGVGGG